MEKLIPEFNYNKFNEWVCQSKTMTCESIIQLHNNLMKQEYLEDGVVNNYGRRYIFKMLNYDYGYNNPKQIPEEIIKFFNSKHVSNYFKQLVKENVHNPKEIVAQAINSKRDFKDFNEEELYYIEEALNKAGFYNAITSLAFKLKSEGTTNFLNNKVDPIRIVSRIVLTSGLNDRAEYYSGRGALISDLNGEHLISIFHKLERLDSAKAISMAKMTFIMPTLGATEFLESLYRLAYNNFNLEQTQISKNNNSLGGARGKEQGVVALASISTAWGYVRDDTATIKNQFARLLPEDVFYQINQNGKQHDDDSWRSVYYTRTRKRG